MQVYLFILSTLLFTGCVTKQSSLSPETKKQIEKNVEGVLEKVFKNSEKLNLEEALVPFDTSSNFFLISNGQRKSRSLILQRNSMM
jgi:hypothetical protein